MGGVAALQILIKCHSVFGRHLIGRLHTRDVPTLVSGNLIQDNNVQCKYYVYITCFINSGESVTTCTKSSALPVLYSTWLVS